MIKNLRSIASLVVIISAFITRKVLFATAASENSIIDSENALLDLTSETFSNQLSKGTYINSL